MTALSAIEIILLTFMTTHQHDWITNTKSYLYMWDSSLSNCKLKLCYN